MSAMIVMSVFDVQAQAFGRPLFVASRGVGVRMVRDEVNRAAEGNAMYGYPQDFRLFELGTFDEHTGLFTCHKLPELVIDCAALREGVAKL